MNRTPFRPARPGRPALLVLVAVLSAQQAMAAAGAWEARTSQGMVLRIGQDSTRSRDAYLLSREYPDGRLDAGFGQAGSLLFALGPDNEGPAALRVDALGRAWVAGATAGTGQSAQAVVMRFLPQGAPDVGYAQGGRSVTAPTGLSARALDLVPLPDGSAWVVGQLLDSRGQERVGWWRLGPDGRVDPRSGLGPLWQDGGTAGAEPVALALGVDGSVALGLRRPAAATSHLELWVLAADGTAPRLIGHAADAPDPDLQHRDGRWTWRSRGQELPMATPPGGPAAAPATTATVAVAPDPVVAQAQPVAASVPAPTAVAPDAAPQAEGPRGWMAWALGGLLAAVLSVGLRRAWFRLRARR